MKRKIKCPSCGHKAHPHKGKDWKCGSTICGGIFNPDEIASGRIEGGDFHSDPTRRLQIAEERIDVSRPLRAFRPSLRGGL